MQNLICLCKIPSLRLALYMRSMCGALHYTTMVSVVLHKTRLSQEMSQMYSRVLHLAVSAL
ncbi:hypothetical protein K443DRAFT_151290 [Laccaria amethystina LaAM-08-1]|uniref:Uncharacterized protein n=1 Tax=Laccaria amethystina LaAM-08-1 TaxID=1095629 RepID=A0A0C9YIA5_9AGAR|nr:hypothetical protein K443DRAFT_151290 [Laccaria amethystina LaAM-08-1]